MRLYLATAWRNGHLADTMVKPAAEARGLVVVSSWHDGAPPADRLAREDLDAKPLELVRRTADTNDREIARADAMLVLWHHECGETFAELRYALQLGKLVAYVGPRFILSAYRQGVQRFSFYGDALTWLAGQLRDRAARSVEPSFVGVFSPRTEPPPATLPAIAPPRVCVCGHLETAHRESSLLQHTRDECHGGTPYVCDCLRFVAEVDEPAVGDDPQFIGGAA